MDRTYPCGGYDAGSIPAEGTRKEKSKSFGSPRFATNLYSILGVKTNSRFRILGEEKFFIMIFFKKR